MSRTQKYSTLRLGLSVFILAAVAISSNPTFGQNPVLRVQATDDPAGWMVYEGDQIFAGYMKNSDGKPIIYPIHGPGGHPMTRNYPMKKDYGVEASDHDHQRSMWFSHGDINGIDFWKDDEGCGQIVHRKGKAETTDKGTVVITTENDWNSPSGERQLSDTRRFEFIVEGRRRFIDCDILLKATDGDVNFGDTKEGSFGMRIATSMRVDSKKGGLIMNASGQMNKDAWGKESPWVDYSGPVDELVGITIHNHPSSFGFPTRWHVRTYGLFAANPFGRYHFKGGKKQDGIVLLDGKTMRLNYRVVLYMGKSDPKSINEDMKSFQNDPRPTVE